MTVLRRKSVALLLGVGIWRSKADATAQSPVKTGRNRARRVGLNRKAVIDATSFFPSMESAGTQATGRPLLVSLDRGML